LKQEHRSINHNRRGSSHAQRSCDTLDNLKRSCSLRRQHQGRSRPDGIARGVHESSGTVSGNARRRKKRSRADASALALQSTATIEADTKDAAGLRRHCTWCARIEWHCFRDSSAGPPCDVHIMHVVGRIGVERRCGAIVTVVGYCRVPNYRLIRPSPQLHLPKLKLISAEALP
jgi:hypothetical protein